MEKFNFKIDSKSLFFGIINDTGGGHTATVSTNLKQQSTTKKELEYFLSLRNEINIEGNDYLINECSSKSKSKVKIIKCLFFKEILVNGEKINTDKEFGIYLKQEIDENAFQYGRIKAHYPIGFRYADSEHEIDNKIIIQLIQERMGGFACLVNSMTIYFDSPKIDFDVSVVGESDTPYSKVFINQKGVGNKFNNNFIEQADSYDYEVVAMKRYLKKEVTTDNYFDTLVELSKKALGVVKEKLLNEYSSDKLNLLCEKYPYAPVDIEYYSNGRKYYIIIKNTSTNINYFFLSKHEWQFLSSNKDKTFVYLVKKISSNKPQLIKFDANQITDMNKEFMSMRLYE